MVKEARSNIKNPNSKFVKIDRDQENRDVIEYQETKDPSILEKIYTRRVPTLQIWARKHGYLINDPDDMFGEMVGHLLEAIDKYDPEKGTFNTLLFTSLINAVRNIFTRKKQKKERHGVFKKRLVVVLFILLIIIIAIMTAVVLH